MNCTDWRNPPFFQALLTFVITVLENNKNEQKFFEMILNALRTTSIYATAPIFDAADALLDLVKAANACKVPPEFESEKFKSLQHKFEYGSNSL